MNPTERTRLFEWKSRQWSGRARLFMAAADVPTELVLTFPTCLLEHLGD